MEKNETIWTLFDSLIQDETEKKILKLIYDEKDSEKIIEELLNIKNPEES